MIGHLIVILATPGVCLSISIAGVLRPAQRIPSQPPRQRCRLSARCGIADALAAERIHGDGRDVPRAAAQPRGQLPLPERPVTMQNQESLRAPRSEAPRLERRTHQRRQVIGQPRRACRAAENVRGVPDRPRRLFRLRFPAGRFTQPSTPHVLGTARRPA